MRGIVIDEAMEDMDKDKDGFIALQEYVGKNRIHFLYDA